MTMKWSASFAIPWAIRSAIIASATEAVWANRIWATAAAGPCAASSLAKRVSRVRLNVEPLAYDVAGELFSARVIDLCKFAAPRSLALSLMATIHRFPASGSLDPKDLEVAASVYADVVSHLVLRPLNEATRESVAQTIIDSMLL